jgi:hypothetical protein
MPKNQSLKIEKCHTRGGGGGAQWAYLDYHADKKNFETKIFATFFFFQEPSNMSE